MSKFDNDFQGKMESHLIEFKEKKQYLLSKSAKKKCFYSELSDNLFPPIRHGFMQYINETGMPLHDYVNHVRSSQVYCVNVFYYLLAYKQECLMKIFSKLIKRELNKIMGFEFEYSPEKNILGEWKSENNRPEEYVTAVDLRIDFSTIGNKVITILIETKFTESSFTSCGGFNSGANQGDTRNVCEHSELLIGDYRKCYLNGAKLKRKYFNEIFNPQKDFKKENFIGACPFIENHQCLRNHSLAQILNEENETYFVLMHHDDNIEIMEYWKKYKAMLNNDSMVFEIAASEIVDNVNDDNYRKYYRDRYLMPNA
jgi:hypothetical protein